MNSTVRLDITAVQEKIAEQGYKYSALADSVGVSTNAIKNWLSGRTRSIYRKNAVLLAKTLGCDVDEIIAPEVSDGDTEAAEFTQPQPPSNTSAPQNDQSCPLQVCDESCSLYPPPALSQSPLGAIHSIFDHRIKVFGLLKIEGLADHPHSEEVLTVFTNLLRSLGGEIEELGTCLVFLFPPPKDTSPTKQIIAATERFRKFAKSATQIKAQFHCRPINYRLVVALSTGNHHDHGLDKVDNHYIAKLLGYVEALASIPAENSAIYCNEHFYQIASTTDGLAVHFTKASFELPKCQFYQLQLEAKATLNLPRPPVIVWRKALVEALAKLRDQSHVHLYGDEGVGKSYMLGHIDHQTLGFCPDHRKVGPICGEALSHQSYPSALSLVAQYVEDLMAAGHSLGEIKQFIRAKCRYVSPIIDSILLSRLDYDVFLQRDRFYDQAALDKLCFLAILRLAQLDSRTYPTVLLIDDYDRLDRFSRDFVDFVLTRSSSLPLLKVVTTGRKKWQQVTAEGTTRIFADRCTSVKIDNFSHSETMEYFARQPYLAQHSSDETAQHNSKVHDDVAGIHSFSGGHPLLLAEINQRWWDYCATRPSLPAPEVGTATSQEDQEVEGFLARTLELEPMTAAGESAPDHQAPEATKAAHRQPHQNLYYLLSKGLTPVQIEALQILSVTDYGVVTAAVLNHLEWSLAGEQKLSAVLATITVKRRSVITAVADGYSFSHRLFHVAFRLSVAEHLRKKIHLVLHSYWEGMLASHKGSDQQENTNLLYRNLLRHSRGCQLYEEYGRYACEFYTLQLKQGMTAGLLNEVDTAIRLLTKVTASSAIHNAICQLYLLKTKIGFLTKGWTHPDILRFVQGCERHDTRGMYQPILLILKVYYYSEQAEFGKVAELMASADKDLLLQELPIVYVALLTIYGGSTFMTGNYVDGLKSLTTAKQVYDAVNSPQLFIDHLDLDYGVWIAGSMAIMYFIAGNSEKSAQCLEEGRALFKDQDHLSTLGCYLLFDSMAGVLQGDRSRVRTQTREYLRKTVHMASAQATIWPFYYWSVGNARMLLSHVETLKAANNLILCSFFQFMAAEVQWLNEDRVEAQETLQEALAQEKQLGQNFVTTLLSSKAYLNPVTEQMRAVTVRKMGTS